MWRRPASYRSHWTEPSFWTSCDERFTASQWERKRCLRRYARMGGCLRPCSGKLMSNSFYSELDIHPVEGISRRYNQNYERWLIRRLGEFFPIPVVEVHLLREIHHGFIDRIAESRRALDRIGPHHGAPLIPIQMNVDYHLI